MSAWLFPSPSWYDAPIMGITILSNVNRACRHMGKWVWIGLLAYSLFGASPAISATYRCHDQSGSRVLTDNPAQLLNCTQLPPLTPSSIFGGLPHSETPKTKVVADLDHSEISQPDQDDISKENSDKKAGKEISVPLTKMGGSFIVHVMLNHERTAQLILDTGASMTVLSTQAAIDLGILGTTDNELLTVNTAGGSVQVNMNYLPSISVGTATATNVAVVIHDLPDIPEHIEGLLGMSFLKHFLITLDAEHARLILRPKQQH